MNEPAANGTRNASIFHTLLASNNATTSQIIALSAVRKFTSKALFLLNPPWMRTQKSQISCGISWKTTASVVAIPVGIFTR